MQVDYLVLADMATVAEGKLYIHGAGWDSLFAGSFPVTHPVMGIAIRLRIPWTDTNQPHRLELDAVNEDGQSILPAPPGPIQGTINVGRPSQLKPGQDQALALAFTINGLTFADPGIYAIIVRLDGLEVDRAAFSVALLPGLSTRQ